MKKSILKRLVKLLDDEVANLKSQIEDKGYKIEVLYQALDQKNERINELFDRIDQFPSNQPTIPEILEAIEILMLPETANNKILNIKAVRCLTGMGLKESKEFVEATFERRRAQETMAKKKAEEKAFLEAEGMSFEVS